jgi:hypothetical protein
VDWSFLLECNKGIRGNNCIQSYCCDNVIRSHCCETKTTSAPTVATIFSKKFLGFHCCNNVFQQWPWFPLLEHIVATMTPGHVGCLFPRKDATHKETQTRTGQQNVLRSRYSVKNTCKPKGLYVVYSVGTDTYLKVYKKNVIKVTKINTCSPTSFEINHWNKEASKHTHTNK